MVFLLSIYYHYYHQKYKSTTYSSLARAESRIGFCITLVYAKCSRDEKLILWEDIYQVEARMSRPWAVGGYFNIVLNSKEKTNGLPVIDIDYEDFQNHISFYVLNKIPFKGKY